MNITVFQSDKGDCLLVTTEDEKRVLVDGGMPGSYTDHVSPFLNNLHENGQELDVVYVSHIDADHIAGILQMMDDKIKWAIYNYQKGQGNNRFRKPKSRIPPKIKEVWHNAFSEQIGGSGAAGGLDNSLEARNILDITSSVLFGSETTKIKDMAMSYQELATSVRQAIKLSRRLSADQLDIKINSPANGKLMQVEADNPPIEIGMTKWQMIGPFKEDLDKLKKQWKKWLKENKKALKSIDVSSQKDQKKIGNAANSEINALINLAELQAQTLGEDLLKQMEANLEQRGGSKKKKIVLGRRSNVTVPNLASLMFLVEEKVGDKIKTVLLTGDGHQDDILKGLEKAGKLDANECIHVDVLKVQHHGSKNNIDRPFLKRVTADNYVFCGNGGHHNPHTEVVDAVIDSRLLERSRSKHSAAEDPFKLWFNCNAENFESDDMSKSDVSNQKHMKELEKQVTSREKKSDGKMKSFFLKGSHFTIKL